MSTTATSSGTPLSTSSHGALRWQMRGNQPEVSVNVVWHRAKPVTLYRAHGFSEVRFDEDSDTLLCRSGPTIVTVLCADREAFSQP